jgi:hypothetical protein
MHQIKQTAAAAFLAGGLVLGVASAAGAATTPAGPTHAARTSVPAQIQVPADYWQKECKSKSGSAWKYSYGKKWGPNCSWHKYSEDKPSGLKECFGGYGPMCGDVTAAVERISISAMVN